LKYKSLSFSIERTTNIFHTCDQKASILFIHKNEISRYKYNAHVYVIISVYFFIVIKRKCTERQKERKRIERTEYMNEGRICANGVPT
jgi:hypothetical protein